MTGWRAGRHRGPKYASSRHSVDCLVRKATLAVRYAVDARFRLHGSWIHLAEILSYRAVRGNLGVGKISRRCTPRLWNIFSLAYSLAVGSRGHLGLCMGCLVRIF